MPSRRALLLALLVAALAGLRLIGTPGLLGYGGAEVYGHAWVQGWHAAALPSWPAGTDLAEGTAIWPVIDPLPTAIAALLGRIINPVFGYNAWILLSVALAFLGGAALARREGGDPVVGGLALALAPSLMGSLASGLTEDGAVGLGAVGLGLVGATDRRQAALGGLCLGLLAASGLVLAWAVGLVAVGFGLGGVWRARSPLIRRLRRPLLPEEQGAQELDALWGLVIGAGVAVAVAIPVALLQGDRLLGQGHHLGSPRELVEPLWRLNPWRGVDLLSLVTPGPQDPDGAFVRIHPGYLGLVALGLAAFAGRSRWWWVLLASVLVAPGLRLSAGGHPLGMSNPFAAALAALPFGGLLNHHGRLLLVGAVALAALASKGAARLGAQRPRLRWVLPCLLTLDYVAISPLPLPLPVADATPPDVATQLQDLSPGPLLVIPAAGPGVHPQRALFDQRAHGRKLLISPNQPGLPPQLARTPTGAWLSQLPFPNPPAPPARLDLPGVAVLLVAAPYVAPVEAALGPPDVRGEDGAAWDLGASP